MQRRPTPKNNSTPSPSMEPSLGQGNDSMGFRGIGSGGGIGVAAAAANNQPRKYLTSGAKKSKSQSSSSSSDAKTFGFLCLMIQFLDFFTTFCTGITYTNFYKNRLHRWLVEYILKHYIAFAGRFFVPTESLLYLLVEVHIYKNETQSKGSLVPKDLLKDVVGEYFSKMILCYTLLWIYETIFDWRGFVMQFFKILLCFLGQYLGKRIWSAISFELGLRKSTMYRSYIKRVFSFNADTVISSASLPG